MLSVCKAEIDGQGREIQEHGTALFPVACYLDDLAAGPVAWHWHDEWEAVVVASGQAVAAVESERYVLEAGQGIFINSGLLHNIWMGDSQHCFLRSTVFHPRLIGGMDSVFWHSYVQPLWEDASKRVVVFKPETVWGGDCIEAIENAWESCEKEGAGFEFRVREQLSRLVCLLLSDESGLAKSREPSEKARRTSQRMKLMFQYIQEHYGEDLRIEQLAECASISVSECLRCFHSTIGTTPIQYVKQFRLYKAARLLAETDWKIVEIGGRCGFQEMSYFADSFKKRFGSTPSEYRKEHKA